MHFLGKKYASFFIGASIAALFVSGCSVTAVPSQHARVAAGQLPIPGGKLIPAADPRFLYEGRFDFSDSNAPVIVWEASRVRLDFSGNRLGLLLDNAEGQNYFDAEVDGSSTIVEANAGKPVTPAVLSGFGPGRHHLLLFKRSEASAGTVRLRGLEVAASANAWAPKPPHYRLRMEFIGDSITVGACNEDGPTDQWTNRLTHDSALSYAALTAAAFDADCRNISVSGMGVSIGFVPMTAGKIWNRLYPETNSPLADLVKWAPQVVFVNLGENDASFTRDHGLPFPVEFTDDYVSLIRALRLAYPQAHIVLLRGGILSGIQSVPYRTAWEAAVARLEAGDNNISHFTFAHSSKIHPRVADDRIMAHELAAWLKQQKFMRSFK